MAEDERHAHVADVTVLESTVFGRVFFKSHATARDRLTEREINGVNLLIANKDYQCLLRHAHFFKHVQNVADPSIAIPDGV